MTYYISVGLGVFLALYACGAAGDLSFGMTIVQFVGTLFLWPLEIALQAYQTHKAKQMSEEIMKQLEKSIADLDSVIEQIDSGEAKAIQVDPEPQESEKEAYKSNASE